MQRGTTSGHDQAQNAVEDNTRSGADARPKDMAIDVHPIRVRTSDGFEIVALD